MFDLARISAHSKWKFLCCIFSRSTSTWLGFVTAIYARGALCESFALVWMVVLLTMLEPCSAALLRGIRIDAMCHKFCCVHWDNFPQRRQHAGPVLTSLWLCSSHASLAGLTAYYSAMYVWDDIRDQHLNICGQASRRRGCSSSPSLLLFLALRFGISSSISTTVLSQ